MGDLDARIAQNIVEQLRRRGRLPQKVIDKLSRIDPEQWYGARVIMVGGDSGDDETEVEAPEDYATRAHSLPFYGTGKALLMRILAWSEIRVIHGVTLHKAKPPREDNAPSIRPLYSGSTITLESGRKFHGAGAHRAPKPRKPGPKARKFGNVPADVARRRLDAERKKREREAKRRTKNAGTPFARVRPLTAQEKRKAKKGKRR